MLRLGGFDRDKRRPDSVGGTKHQIETSFEEMAAPVRDGAEWQITPSPAGLS
jgi:hypothetical protein